MGRGQVLLEDHIACRVVLEAQEMDHLLQYFVLVVLRVDFITLSVKFSAPRVIDVNIRPRLGKILL